MPAETARLIGLGATEVSQWLECRVLRAPGGHLLCVLPVESPPELFAAEARALVLTRRAVGGCREGPAHG